MNSILKTIDIIIPVYNESANIPALFSEIKKVLLGRFEKVRIIVVDDGSNDSTSEVIVKSKELYSDFNILYIRFTRNYGKEIAVKCGIDHRSEERRVWKDFIYTWSAVQ